MLSDALISRLTEHLSAHMGLFFPEKRRNEIRQKMTAAMTDFGFEDAEGFIHWLLSAPLTKQQVEKLACHLTVQETYFFREIKTIEVLEQVILPELINSRRKTEKRIRIWSAGCATGEEPYSIAILLSKLIPDIRDWSITILATDINPDGLKKARQGIYSEWSFRDTPQWVSEEYFEKIKRGHYAIRPPVKEMVTFSYLNLYEDNYPSLSNGTNAMDLILCRNVLMYFAPGSALSVIRRFNRSLLRGSFLIVSTVEVSPLFSSDFDQVRIRDVTLYKKNGGCKEQAKTVHLSIPHAKNRPERPRDAARPFEQPGKPHKKENVEKEIKKEPAPHEEAAALYGQGQYREAEDKLAGILAGNHEDLKAIILFARVLANQGRLSDAFKWCEKAVSVDKMNPGLHYLRATVLEELGDTDGAMISLNKALYLDPGFVLAHFAMGNLATRLGKHVESKKHLRNTMELLSRYKADEILPESEGITAGRLAEILSLTNPGETA